MKLILSNTSRGAYNGLVKEIQSNIFEGQSNIVIAPDRFTATVERGIIESLGESSSFSVEVVSFSNLASKVLGPSMYKCLTEEGCIMLISSILSKNKAKLGCYGNVYNKDGLAKEIFKTIEVFRKSGIQSADITANLESMPPYLKLKATDLAFLYDEYINSLKDHFNDSCSILEEFAKYLSENPDYASNIHFYCTDLYEFNQPELDILKQIDKYALSLTISIPSGRLPGLPNNPNARIYPDLMINKLRDISDSLKEETVLDDIPNHIEMISSHLFSYSKPKLKVDCNNKVRIVKAKDTYNEILKLAVEIMKYVRADKNNRYKDFEVCVGNLDAYSHDIKDIFSRYNIPFFIDENQKLIEQTKIKYLLAALDCAKSQFKRRDVLDLIKNPLFYSNIKDGENLVFNFENYILKYNIDYTIFKNPFTLGQEGVDDLQGAEIIRNKLVDVLKPFDGLKKEALPLEYIDMLQSFLKKVDDAWVSHVKKLAEISSYYSKCSEQVDRKLNQIFEEIDKIFKEDVMSFDEFSKILVETIKSKSIVLIPTSLDCVSIGGTQSRYVSAKNICIIGATYNNIPQRQIEESLVSPKDEEFFEKIDLKISPSYQDKTNMHMYAICDLIKKADDSLYISYPEMSISDRANPSTIIYEIEHLLSNNGKNLEEEYVNYDETKELTDERLEELALVLSSDKACYHELLRNVVSNRLPLKDAKVYTTGYTFLDDNQKSIVEKIGTIPENIDPTLIQIPDSTSASRIETFYSCPYKYYMNYMLSLEKRKDASLAGTENGTILHGMLDQCFRDIRDGKVTCKEDIENKAKSYFDKVIEEEHYERFLQIPETKRLLLRLIEEGKTICVNLFEIMQRSEFKPEYLEEKLSSDGAVKGLKLPYGDKEFSLRGKIDRVDVLDDEFYIIDYKTYKSAKFELKDLYYGEKVQLYLYMKAVQESLHKNPVGIFYLPLFSGFDTDENNRYQYKGQSINDINVLKKIDNMVDVDETKSIVEIKRKASKIDKATGETIKGELTGNGHISKEDFDLFGEYAKKISSKGAEIISEGYIKPSPASNACDRCDFADICNYNMQFERKLSAPTKDTFIMEDKQ